MAQRRRKFAPQQKAEAVQFLIETGRPVAEIACELEINEGTLGSCGQVEQEPDTGITSGLDIVINSLRREPIIH